MIYLYIIISEGKKEEEGDRKAIFLTTRGIIDIQNIACHPVRN